MASYDKPIRSKLGASLAAELSQLIGRAVDTELAENERARLNEILAGDGAARSHYLRYISLHSTLMATAGNQARQEVEALKMRLSAKSVFSDGFSILTPKSRLLSPPASAPSHVSMWPIGTLAAALLFMLLTASVVWFSGRFATERPATVHLASEDGDTEVIEPVHSMGRNVARVSYVSRSTRWQHPNDSFAVDSIVRTGNMLRLARGEVELLYSSGVKLMLFGPAEFLVQDIGGELRCGGLVASVPETGHGFTIETPNGKVIDLGTEFGVVVDDFGVSEVSVFEGKVEAFPAGLAESSTKKIELTKGRALQWSSDTLVSMDADRKRFASSLSYSSPVSTAVASRLASLESAFRESQMNTDKWTPLGDVETSGQGLVMSGKRDQSRQPCIVSTDEFDPAGGPVTVVCDIRFPFLQGIDAPSFSILTRSANQRSDIDAPWDDILATCVRCNFRSDENSPDGTLETSTKYEPDRELTKISWRGFQRPQADVSYRLVMRDDGVNVSFTVSPVDNPSVQKTVMCRSLFRGYKNHIALEGWNNGTTIVDRVMVYQDPPVDTLTRLTAREPATRATNPPPTISARENGLSSLIPADARLVLEDHFEGTAIDSDRWATLGVVELRDGRVSLGKAIEAAHINTWHPRPYLLSREQFTPSDGKLFILGRIEFAENFLQGYGGSFAVMTRSDRRRGSGPGWEYSVLKSGVRSNFWPAAPGHDHNLEIHEKSTLNTISLLAGAGLEINPHARSYLFCVEDDGHHAKITIQGADDPAILESLNHPTSAESPQSGYIGFESCWGSPVLLDDLQIFVSGRNTAREVGD